MTARSRMTQRALVERDTQTESSDSGNPLAPEWEVYLEELPCWLYSSAGREAVDENRTAVVEDIRLMVPMRTDVTERDRINGITDRLGATVLDGICNIRSVLFKRDHMELLLTRVTS